MCKAPPPTSHNFFKCCARLAHVLYLPVVLAIARLAICNNDGTLSVDPEVSCINPFLVVLVVFGAGVVSVSTLHLVRNATKVRGDVVQLYDKRSGNDLCSVPSSIGESLGVRE